MKNLVMSIFTVLLGICCLCIVCAISGRNARQMELASNLSNAVESTVKYTAEQQDDGIISQEEFLADFMEKLSLGLETDSTVTVHVWKADEKKGLLGIEVAEMFLYPNGKQGKVKCSRTAVLEQKTEKNEEHTVKFYLNKEDMLSDVNCYKTFVIAEGEKVNQPAEPALEGKTFRGWADANDYMADFTQVVQEDITYYGEWAE